MSDCSKEVRNLILQGLGAIRGDDLEWAQRAWGELPESAMGLQYGASGKTRRQLLEECQKHAEAVDRAAEWVKKNLAVAP